MSISAVGGYGMTGMLQSNAMRPPGGSQDPDEFASTIIGQDDTDGDGLLSLGETPLEEDKFNSIDTDGDGYLSEDELSADFQSRMDELANKASMFMQGLDPSAMAQSIVESDDADGDGVLSLDETPLDEDRFNEIDADGDGFITAEELSADAQQHMAEAGEGMMASPPPMGESAAAGGSSSSGSSGSESEEEYDAYDLNEDGQVSLDELLQAFRNGDSSLEAFFGEGGGISALTQRLAMNAYAAQSA